MPRTVTLRAVLVISVLAVVAAVTWILTQGEGDDLSYWGYEFTLESEFDDIRFLSYRSPGEQIDMTVIRAVDADAATRMIDEKVGVFADLFEKQRVGYAGQHTEFVECPGDLKPVYHERSLESGVLRYFSAYANNRLTMGVCIDEDIAHAALSIYLHCLDSATVYDINYFTPSPGGEDPATFVDKLTCDD